MTAEIPFSKSFTESPELTARHTVEELEARALRLAELNKDTLKEMKRDGGIITPPELPGSSRPRRTRRRVASGQGPVRLP